MIDILEDNKVPEWDENKQLGYAVCKCGYQRKEYTFRDDEVTCRACNNVITKEFKKRADNYLLHKTIEQLKKKITAWEDSVNTLKKTNFKKALMAREQELEDYRQQLKALEG
jgi:hypothetical protein